MARAPIMASGKSRSVFGRRSKNTSVAGFR